MRVDAESNAHRRQLVVQQRQLINAGGRQLVAPHGVHLPEFEEDELQFLGGLSRRNSAPTSLCRANTRRTCRSRGAARSMLILSVSIIIAM